MKNKTFSIENYISTHHEIFKKIDINAYNAASDLIVNKIKNNKKIITCGNGGSASTASHFITDWNKMYNIATKEKFRGICLCDNIGLITAYGNDINYDEVFAGQLDAVMDEGDLLIVVSGSGNSPNIISAIKKAHEIGGSVIGVLGYDGGRAISLCDEVFHVPSWDMQLCEDIHLSFGHLVMKRICGEGIRPSIT